MKREKQLETILVLVLASGIGFWITDSAVFLIVAAVIGFIGVFIPFIADKIHWAWMKLAHMMGFVMSKVLLSIIYAVFLLPLAYLARLFGNRNNVHLKGEKESYFVERNVVYTKKSMENLW